MPALPRDLFRLWLILLIVWLVPLYAAWWWLGWAEWVLRVLRGLGNIALPPVFNQGVSEILLQADQSWKVRTGLVTENSNPSEMAVFFIEKPFLLHIIMGFPLLWALLLATPGHLLKRLIWGTLLLVALYLLGIAGHMWAMITVMVNHQPSVMDETLVPPLFRVSAVPYPLWMFHLSGFVHYLTVLILPLISPVLIWLLLCPRGVMRLVVSIRRRIR